MTNASKHKSDTKKTIIEILEEKNVKIDQILKNNSSENRKDDQDSTGKVSKNLKTNSSSKSGKSGAARAPSLPPRSLSTNTISKGKSESASKDYTSEKKPSV